MSKVVVAATQMSCSENRDKNIESAERLIREAAGKGAQIILLQELFETLYFCQEEKTKYFKLAMPMDQNPAVKHFSSLAKELRVVLPISFFEKANHAHYNTIAVIDSDGCILGKYRKTHIPDAPGYSEKFYFNPGDTGFRVWKTQYATIGVGVCWDQWFPEAARSMVLKGAEILFYPTAFGSTPSAPDIDNKDFWQICMRGHAAANFVPVIASNRIGTETSSNSAITFFGSSFVSNYMGKIIAEADRRTESVITSSLDLSSSKYALHGWRFFRDRRPEMYETLLTMDGGE